MGPNCFRHPAEAGGYYCAKYNRYLCEDCLSCQSPGAYCRFRTMCTVWEEIERGDLSVGEEAGEG